MKVALQWSAICVQYHCIWDFQNVSSVHRILTYVRRVYREHITHLCDTVYQSQNMCGVITRLSEFDQMTANGTSVKRVYKKWCKYERTCVHKKALSFLFYTL